VVRRIGAGEVIMDWSECSEVLSDEAVNALPREERRCVSVMVLCGDYAQTSSSLAHPASVAPLRITISEEAVNR